MSVLQFSWTRLFSSYTDSALTHSSHDCNSSFSHLLHSTVSTICVLQYTEQFHWGPSGAKSCLLHRQTLDWTSLELNVQSSLSMSTIFIWLASPVLLQDVRFPLRVHKPHNMLSAKNSRIVTIRRKKSITG